MAKATFSKFMKAKMAFKVEPSHVGGTWHGKAYPHICKKLQYNFLDGDIPIYCNLKQQTGSMIHYHQGAKHLNSSQVMCISFFKKFFETPEREVLLLKIINELITTNPTNNSMPAGATITAAFFEYEPDHAERTNFDFYLELSSGAHISIEVKFTESDFGKISSCKNDPQKYARKWNNTYVPLLSKCAFTQNKLITCKNSEQTVMCTKNGFLRDNCMHGEDCFVHEFYEHYQIWRNIAYASSPLDIVLFLTPRSNDSLSIERTYIDVLSRQFDGPTIQNIYWEDLIKTSLTHAKNDAKLYDYLKRFAEKYLLQ